ncbi:MAG TPA: IclR family transcriptional regulator [Actinomycetota bacterium]
MPRTGRPASRTVQSVDRGLTLLWMLAGAEGGLGVVEASERLGVDPSTVSRLLASLVAADLVVRDPVSGRYAVGPGAARLAASVPASPSGADERELRQAARRTLYLLEEGTGETVLLDVPSHGATHGPGMAVVVDVVPSRRVAPRLLLPAATRPLYATADGKVLLAHALTETLERVLAAERPRLTPRTIGDPAVLRIQLTDIRRRGFSITEGEAQPGVNVIAAPVQGPTGAVIAALAIEGPADRFDRIGMRRALDLLLPRATELSRRLGAPAPGGRQPTPGVDPFGFG